MRLGKVAFVCAYVVDLDNKSMVAHAKSAILEDLRLVTYTETMAMIECTQDEKLTAGDIPSWLVEMSLPEGALFKETKPWADS